MTEEEKLRDQLERTIKHYGSVQAYNQRSVGDRIRISHSIVDHRTEADGKQGTVTIELHWSLLDD